MMQSVQVIIERLKSHPEDFFGDLDENKSLAIRHPRFYELATKLDDLLLPNKTEVHRLWYLEPEEKDALLAAYKEARRARFEAKVFHTLLTKQEPDPQYDINMDRMSPSGKRLMQGAMWQGAVPKAEGATIAEHINKEFEKQYAKNSRT